jgi:hypothetical protein
MHLFYLIRFLFRVLAVPRAFSFLPQTDRKKKKCTKKVHLTLKSAEIEYRVDFVSVLCGFRGKSRCLRLGDLLKLHIWKLGHA